MGILFSCTTGLIYALLSIPQSVVLDNQHQLTSLELENSRLGFGSLQFENDGQSNERNPRPVDQVTAETIRLELAHFFPKLQVSANNLGLVLEFTALGARLSTRTNSLIEMLSQLPQSKSLNQNINLAKRNAILLQRRSVQDPKKLLDIGIAQLTSVHRGDQVKIGGELSALKKITAKGVRQNLVSLFSRRTLKVHIRGPNIKLHHQAVAAVLKSLSRSPHSSAGAAETETEPMNTGVTSQRILVIDRPGMQNALVGLFQVPRAEDSKMDLGSWIGQMAFSQLAHGRMGESIRKAGASLVLTPSANRATMSGAYLLSFTSPKPQLPRLLRQLRQLWKKTKQEGLPESDIRAAKAHFTSQHLHCKDGARQPSWARSNQGKDRWMTANIDAKELSAQQINLSFAQDLDPKMIQTVIVTDASGELLKALAQDQGRSPLEIISYDAFM